MGPQIFATRPPHQVKRKYLFYFFCCTIVNLTITQPRLFTPPTVSLQSERGEGSWRKIEFVSRVIFKAVDYRQLRGESVFKYCPGEITNKRKHKGSSVIYACNRRLQAIIAGARAQFFLYSILLFLLFSLRTGSDKPERPLGQVRPKFQRSLTVYVIVCMFKKTMNSVREIIPI